IGRTLARASGRRRALDRKRPRRNSPHHQVFHSQEAEMTPSLLLDDILIWSAQVCFLVTVGALAALTLRHPRGRLVFWQGILAISLLLPAVQPWTQRPSADAGGVSIETRMAVIPSESSE